MMDFCLSSTDPEISSKNTINLWGEKIAFHIWLNSKTQLLLYLQGKSSLAKTLEKLGFLWNPLAAELQLKLHLLHIPCLLSLGT